MIISTRKYYSTTFILYYSRVNQCFIFRRDDVGSNIETKLLNDYDEGDAKQYFNDKVCFYCEVNNLSLDQMEF